MSGPDDALRLLAMARRDLRAAAGMVHDADTLCDEVFGFHAQQAVEKALKSWLCLLEVIYPKTHDLYELFALLREAGVGLPEQTEELRDLVDFAVQYRYQAFDEPLPLDRSRTLVQVRDLVTTVAAKLPAGDHAP